MPIEVGGTVKTGSGATGARPSASTAGAGAQWFDTTLQRPIWSNGSAWLEVAAVGDPAAVSLQLTNLPTDDMATGDGQAAYLAPAPMNGMILTAVLFVVAAAGTTGTSDVQIRRRRAGADVDMLSTKVTIDSAETTSATGATAAVINAGNAAVATGDLIYVDVDALSTAKPKGGVVSLEFRLP